MLHAAVITRKKGAGIFALPNGPGPEHSNEKKKKKRGATKAANHRHQDRDLVATWGLPLPCSKPDYSAEPSCGNSAGISLRLLYCFNTSPPRLLTLTHFLLVVGLSLGPGPGPSCRHHLLLSNSLVLCCRFRHSSASHQLGPASPCSRPTFAGSAVPVNGFH